MTAPTLPHTPWHAAAQLHRWAPALAGLALLIMYFPTYRALDEFIWGVVGQGPGLHQAAGLRQQGGPAGLLHQPGQRLGIGGLASPPVRQRHGAAQAAHGDLGLHP